MVKFLILGTVAIRYSTVIQKLIDGCSVVFCAMSETKWMIYILIIKK